MKIFNYLNKIYKSCNLALIIYKNEWKQYKIQNGKTLSRVSNNMSVNF